MFRKNFLGQKAMLTVAFFIVLTMAGTQIAQADWAPPTSAPPDGNVSAPINVSGSSQTKQGSLTIAGEYLALPTGGLFYSQNPAFNEPHINFSNGTLYLSPGDDGDHTELQGKVKITRVGGNEGELSVQNLVSCASLETDENGKLQCAPGSIGLPPGVDGDTLRNDNGTWVTNDFLYNNGAQVGVGITDPGNRFEVGQDIGGYLALRRDDTDNNISAGDDLGALYFTGDHGAVSDIIGAEIKAKADDGWALNNYTTRLSFYTRGAAAEAERMTIDSSGRVGIGTANPLEQLHLTGTIRTPMANCTYLRTDANGNITCVSGGNPPGEPSEPLGNGLNGAVLALAIWNGELYAGGLFTMSGGTSVNHVARWNGTSWQPLGNSTNNGTNSTVYGLYGDNGALWVVGTFTTAAGQAAKYVATWDGGSWHNHNTETFDAPAYAVGKFDNQITIGGDFTSYTPGHGYALDYLAFCIDTCQDWVRIGTDNTVVSIYSNNDYMYIGGMFDSVDGGSNFHRIARQNHAHTWSRIGGISNNGANAPVRSMYQLDGDLYYGGDFTARGGTAIPLRHLAKYSDSVVSEAANANDSVRAISSDPAGNLVIGGSFTFIDGQPMNYIARRLDNVWSQFNAGLNGQVNALIQYGGGVVAGGSFSSSGGTAVNNIAIFR